MSVFCDAKIRSKIKLHSEYKLYEFILIYQQQQKQKVYINNVIKIHEKVRSSFIFFFYYYYIVSLQNNKKTHL